MLERRGVLGGAAVTEEFHPGFKSSTVAHVLGPLRASVAEDLDLANRGLGFVEPEPRVFAPRPDGGGVALWGDPGKTAFEMRKLSARTRTATRRSTGRSPRSRSSCRGSCP